MKGEGSARTSEYNSGSEIGQEQNLETFERNKLAIVHNQPLEELQHLDPMEEYEEPEDEELSEEYSAMNEEVEWQNEEIAQHNEFVDNYNALLRKGDYSKLPENFGKQPEKTTPLN